MSCTTRASSLWNQFIHPNKQQKTQTLCYPPYHFYRVNRTAINYTLPFNTSVFGMLRTRDFIALILAAVLTKMAWNDDPLDALSALVHLAFYVPLAHEHNHEHDPPATASAPVLLDLDGDGTVEVMAILQNNEIHILDLKRATTKTKPLAPFQPPLLLKSEPLRQLQEATKPILLAYGRVQMRIDDKNSSAAAAAARSVAQQHYYYCGTTWHDASTRCGTPCPDGNSHSCPTGERCFADCASCEALVRVQQKQQPGGQQPAGSSSVPFLPSIITMYENGAVTCHGILIVNNNKKSASSKLELVLQWTTNPLANYTAPTHAADNNSNNVLLALDNHHVLLDDSVVFVTARVNGTLPFTAALDAETGVVLWQTDLQLLHPNEETLLLPAVQGSMSAARRRSHKPKLARDDAMAATHCMGLYRRSLLTSGAFPHYGRTTRRLKVLHFETITHKQQYQQKHSREKALLNRKWKQQQRHLLPKKGKPNVVVSYQDTHGLQVRSLKNGRSLCHLSLWDDTLYADLNHDGILDSVSLIVGDDGSRRMYDDKNLRWLHELEDRVANLQRVKTNNDNNERATTNNLETPRMCHVQALSGVPGKEEIFAVNICGNPHDNHNLQNHPMAELHAAPPLVMEPIHGRKGDDLVVAVNHGYVTRIHGSTGKKQWQLVGTYYADFPYWTDDSHALLARIESKRVLPSTRPIVLCGDNSLALFTARHGKLLAMTNFPQPQSSRAAPPLVADFTGDGTSDIIITTADAIWGYQIHVGAGSSVFGILVGLLLMGTMLALLRNQFGPQPGKRSTDA
jgi:hypothetical protein